MNFLLILTHKKSTFREKQRQHLLSTNNGKFIFYYFIGDTNLESDYLVDEINNIVYLKVPDNYESLSLKTYYAMKFISENYPNITGVFKTDDDIDLDLEKISKCIEYFKLTPYFGLSNKSNSYDSTYHFGKCESLIMNRKPIHIPDCSYCAGGGYYVSKSSINNILNNLDIFKEIIFEDVAVGVAMNKSGIFPTYVNVKDNGCMWGVNDKEMVEEGGDIMYFKIPNRVNTEICSCGAPKDRRISNFCQKCHKLY
jgi:predicted nucleic acid-binding Zn finger protein